jgi:NADH-quinone oxidoreductase subunit G
LISTNYTGRANNGLLAGSEPTIRAPGSWVELNLGAGRQSGGHRRRQPCRRRARAAVALVEAAQAGTFVVVQELFLTETARLADVVFPAQAFTEREGSLTSGERRVQRFYPAVSVLPDCRADFQIAGMLAQRLGLDVESQFAARVMGRLVAKARRFAEIGANPYRRLAETEAQWPIIGRADLYYGGTMYENSQGWACSSPCLPEWRNAGFIPAAIPANPLWMAVCWRCR